MTTPTLPGHAGLPGGAFDRLVLRNFVKLGAGELVSRLVGFVGTIVIARQLGVESYGVIGLGFAVLLYFAAIGDLGMEHLGPREVASEEAPVDVLASTITFARFVASSIIALLMAAVGLWLVTEPEGPILALYGLTLIAMGASTRWVHIGLGGTGAVGVSRMVVEILRVGLLLTLVRGPDDLFRVPIIQFAGEAAATVMLWVVLARRGVRMRFRIDTSVLRIVLRRAFPLLITNLLALVIYNADIVVLRVFRDRTEVGLYLAAYTLINFLGVLGNTATLSILPTLSRLRSSPGRGIELIHRGQAQMMALGLPLAVGGALLAAPILRIVFSAEYTPATTVLQVLILSIPLLFQRCVLQAVLISAGRQDRVLQVTAWSAVVTIGLNLALVPVLGMLGAGIATIAAEAARLALAQQFATVEGYPRVSIPLLWRPAFAAALMAAALIVAPDLSILILIPAGALVYGAVLGGAGGFRLFTSPASPVERAS
jgi:O-antigen/teichoic acid export membrane protein